MATDITRVQALDIYSRLRKTQKIDIAKAMRSSNPERNLNRQLSQNPNLKKLTKNTNLSSQLLKHYNKVKVVREHQIAYPYHKWTPAQSEFVSSRRSMPTNSLVSSYNYEFPDSPRSYSSIYRVQKA